MLYLCSMKHTSSLTTGVSALAVFAITFTMGFAGGESLVTSSDGMHFLQGTLTQSSVTRVPRKRRMRRVNRKAIVRPTRRSASGSVASVERVIETNEAIKAACGDKLVLLKEECDDGNILANDGCSATCTIETGYVCNSRQPSECWATCGDGAKAAIERCDDGNTINGDGCTSLCKVESGYTCTGAPSDCDITPYCGDGIKSGTEQCDDMNGTPGDGCHLCKTE